MSEEKNIVPIKANGKGLVLTSLEDYYRFGQYVVSSRLAPASFNTAEQVLIAVQTGAELGMPPMRALQSLCVINGQARLYGDAPLALVRQSGKLEWIKEKIEGEGDEMVAICIAQRDGEPEPIERTFSVEDAINAKLWKKAGPWTQYPKRMLQMRARSLCLRDGFPDCFGGATIAEEYMGLPEPAHETTTPKRVESQQKDIEPNLAAREIIEEIFRLYESAYDEPSIEGFAKEVAELTGGAPDDYYEFDFEEHVIKEENFTIEKVNQLKSIFNGIIKIKEHKQTSQDGQTQTPETNKTKKEKKAAKSKAKYTCNGCKRKFDISNEGKCPHCLSLDIKENEPKEDTKTVSAA